MQATLEAVETAWSEVDDEFDPEALRAEAGFGRWSTYSGASTSPGKCC